jgi:hypothetical protein
LRDFLVSLTRNPISLVGVAITTAAAILIVTLFAIEWIGFLGNPYVGILTYLVLPAIFLLGLALIPIGIARDRRRLRRVEREGGAPEAFPVIDLNRPRTRQWLLVFLLLTAVNVVILASATYKGVEVMESVEFCGTTCHSVMAPQHTAHQLSPHASVACVDCHIGPGADWFVKSKLAGAWQVVSVTFDQYPRPIPTPVEDLRPANETCENCHTPAAWVGDRLSVTTTFADDVASTPMQTVLLMHVGGARADGARGIHWHADPGTRIRYQSDPSRGTVHRVVLETAGGESKTFTRSGEAETEAEAGSEAEWRAMDCVDCHNRPGHAFRLPERAVDRALDEGRLARDLPYLRREAVRLVGGEYASQDAAAAEISEGLAAFYRENHPEVFESSATAVAEAGRVLAAIHAENVFPHMEVGWGTYPDHVGHEDFPGCFRCHDDELETADGQTITQDCSLCHVMIAVEEEEPEILEAMK